MSHSDVRERVLAEPWLGGVPGATGEAIEAAAARIGHPLPDALRVWLSNCNGVIVGPEALYGVDQTIQEMDVEYRQSLHRGWAEAGWLPVAGDGMGNAYIVDLTARLSDRPDAVFFVDVIESSGPSYVIASNLWTFIDKYSQRDKKGSHGWQVWRRSEAAAIDPALVDMSSTVAKPWALAEP